MNMMNKLGDLDKLGNVTDMGNTNKARAEGFLLGTIVGAAVASITALLFAPKSGKALRQDIADQASEAKEKGMELKDSAQEYGSQYMDNAKETLNKAKDQVESNIKSTDNDLDSIKETARKTADELGETAKEGVEKDKDITDDAIKDVQN